MKMVQAFADLDPDFRVEKEDLDDSLDSDEEWWCFLFGDDNIPLLNKIQRDIFLKSLPSVMPSQLETQLKIPRGDTFCVVRTSFCVDTSGDVALDPESESSDSDDELPLSDLTFKVMDSQNESFQSTSSSALTDVGAQMNPESIEASPRAVKPETKPQEASLLGIEKKRAHIEMEGGHHKSLAQSMKDSKRDKVKELLADAESNGKLLLNPRQAQFCMGENQKCVEKAHHEHLKAKSASKIAEVFLFSFNVMHNHDA